jgi:predicted transcriptional regulator
MNDRAGRDDGDTRRLREVLARRERLLAALGARPMDQRDLRDEVGISRSTAYKSLGELEDAGLVRQGGDGRYRLTQFGSLVHRRHSEYVARVGRLERARPVVEALPDDLLVPLSFLERGHTVVASPNAPERPLERLDAESERSHGYRVLSPIAVPRFLPGIHERVERGDLVAELLVGSGAVEYLRQYERFDEALLTDGFDLLRTDEPVEFGLFVRDDRELAALFAYGPQGSVVGMVLSDAPEAYRWADRTYRRYRESATPVEPRAADGD